MRLIDLKNQAEFLAKRFEDSVEKRKPAFEILEVLDAIDSLTLDIRIYESRGLKDDSVIDNTCDSIKIPDFSVS